MTIQTLQHANEIDRQIQSIRLQLDRLRQFQQQSYHHAIVACGSAAKRDGIQYITIHYKDDCYLDELDITPYSDIYALLTTIIADQEQHLQSLQHELSEL